MQLLAFFLKQQMYGFLNNCFMRILCYRTVDVCGWMAREIRSRGDRCAGWGGLCGGSNVAAGPGGASQAGLVNVHSGLQWQIHMDNLSDEYHSEYGGCAYDENPSISFKQR